MYKKQDQNANVLNGISFVLQEGKYLGVMILTTATMYIFLAISMQVLILNPLFFNTQMAFGSDMRLEGKIFLYIAPILFGLALTLMVYRFRELKTKFGKEDSLTTTGLIASLFVPGCSVCLTLVLSSVGITYAIFNSVIIPFIIPIQIFVYLLLLISIYLLSKDVCIKCLVKKKR